MPRKEIVPTGSEIMDLVNSQDFCTLLARAATRSWNTDHETGFNAYRDEVTGKYYWSPVFEGTNSQIPRELYDDWEIDATCDGLLPVTVNRAMLIHTHPHVTNNLDLSYSDLKQLATPGAYLDDKFDVRPVVGICDVAGPSNGHLLLLRRKFYQPKRQPTSLYDEVWERYHEVAFDWPNQQVADAIQASGDISAAIVPYSIDRSAPISARVTDQDAIRRFAANNDVTVH